MPGPLAGIRVIDLTHNVLGPLATQVLGDAGADVIKIEGPGGDPVRKIGPSRTADMGAYFYQLNRNKRSVVLDLKKPEARLALRHLVAGADVFVHNIRTGAATRLGLSYADLVADNPRLIYASASGFRQDSRLRDEPAFDDTMQGACGLASLNRDADGAPRYVPTVIADKVCGQVLASAIGMALFHRERSGQGQEIHVPMMDTMLAFLLVEHLWGASIDEPERGLGYPRMLTPHRRPYATKDGHVCVIAVTDEQWSRLFAVIGRAELMLDPRFATPRARANHIDELYAVLTAAMLAHTTAEWLHRLGEADLPCGPVNSLEALMHDEYLDETGFFQDTEHPSEGRTTLLRNPVWFSKTPTGVSRLPPKLGADTDTVLKEIAD